MISALVLSSLATAVLKSVMSISAPTPRLETATDILKKKPEELTVAVLAGGGILEILEESVFDRFREFAALSSLKQSQAQRLLMIEPHVKSQNFGYFLLNE